ncbi:hypothetical protein Cni_G17172 [Canna indica]|uniref:Uncharacterized protein n=1 Tax=Canna indica TaxID=4628 RepID=A0AAQ3KH95_9LILI|nr:hypothetical protein Cni_G17172 [Canna indica]
MEMAEHGTSASMIDVYVEAIKERQDTEDDDERIGVQDGVPEYDDFDYLLETDGFESMDDDDFVVAMKNMRTYNQLERRVLMKILRLLILVKMSVKGVSIATCYKAKKYAWKMMLGTLKEHYNLILSYMTELKKESEPEQISLRLGVFEMGNCWGGPAKAVPFSSFFSSGDAVSCLGVNSKSASRDRKKLSGSSSKVSAASVPPTPHKNQPPGEHNLVDWARPYLTSKRKIFRILDARLEGQYSLEGAQKAAILALHCLSSQPRHRPIIDQVVSALQQLQDAKDIGRNPQYEQKPNGQNIGDNSSRLVRRRSEEIVKGEVAHPTPSASPLHTK